MHEINTGNIAKYKIRASVGADPDDQEFMMGDAHAGGRSPSPWHQHFGSDIGSGRNATWYGMAWAWAMEWHGMASAASNALVGTE